LHFDAVRDRHRAEQPAMAFVEIFSAARFPSDAQEASAQKRQTWRA
jgi:hypothetical protein